MKRVLFLLLVLLTTKAVLAESPVYFADPNLKAAVEEELGVSDPNATDMLGLTYLEASKRGIGNLTGLEYAVNIETLYLATNDINDLSPLSGLTNLTHLRLYSNSISDVSALSGVTSLVDLSLQYNRIGDVSPLSGLINLQYLGLIDNLITDVSPLSGLVNLNRLDLSTNEITDISALSSLTNLTELNLNYSQISDISALSGLTNLQRLSLYNNLIEDISPLSALDNLSKLALSHNQILDCSALAGLTNLTELELRYNQISDISPLSGLTNLTRLDLTVNNIEDIYALSNLTKLAVLSLYGNDIGDILPLAPLTDLTYLNLAENQTQNISVLAGLTKLTVLDLHHNQICDISALSDLRELTELRLETNPLNAEAYCSYIPLIQANNPGIEITYDPPPPTLDCNGLNYYVDGVNGSDDNDGLTLETAFATIQKGIDEANHADTVLVYPALYSQPLDFCRKAITVQGVATEAGVPIVETPMDYAFSFYTEEEPNSVLKNFVVRNCYLAVFLIDASPTISNLTIVNNWFGVEAYAGSQPDISNCIFYNNTNGDLSGCEARYSWVGEDVNEPNEPNIPLFADANGGDYHLLSERGRYWPEHDVWVLDDVTSPCVDGGDPNNNPGDEQMPNGGRINMGAYGGTAYASMSEWAISGDVSKDGIVNFKDIAIVGEQWLDKFGWVE